MNIKHMASVLFSIVSLVAFTTVGCSAEPTDETDDMEEESTGVAEAALTDFQQKALDKHNNERSRHWSTPPMTWSTTLASGAQSWANGCSMQHSSTAYGENIYYGPSTDGAIKAANNWIGEGSNYNYSDNTPPAGDLHFTQVVWAGTTQLGCGQATCGSQTFIVCRYAPAGNVSGQFTANVKTCKYGRTGGTTGACKSSP